MRKNVASRINSNFDNFDLGGLITVLAGRAVPVASKATGKADLTFTGTDFTNATGSVNAQLVGAAPAGSDLAPLSGDFALTAANGLFQIQNANLRTAATTLTASGQFSVDQPVSNLRVNLASTDASELQHLLISSGAIPELDEQFRTYGIDLAGKLAFNGTINGALKDPIVSGHAELGSLLINQHDLGSLAANISSTAAETRVTEGRLAQANGGGAQFALTIPRTGTDNISIDATVERMNAGDLIVALPLNKQTREQLGDTAAEVSGTIKISGIPKAMNGVADLQFGKGRLAGEPLQNLTAHATFVGTSVTVDKLDAAFDAGHIAGNGKFDTETQAFELRASADPVQLERLAAFANKPNLPKIAGTVKLDVTASGNMKATDFSNYQINFDGESNDVTIDGQSAGNVKLIGRTENKQLSVTFTTTGLLGDQGQTITARVDLSNEKLPATIESNITNADLSQILKIYLASQTKDTTTPVNVTGRASGTLKLAGNLMPENEEVEEVFSWRGLTGTATFTELSFRVEDAAFAATGPVMIDFKPNEIVFNDSQFQGPGTNVRIGGAVATAAGGRNTLAINGQVNLQILRGVSPDLFSSGFADVAINVGGTYENQRVTGRASLRNASVTVFLGNQSLKLANLQGAILFNSSQAQIESLTGTLGGGTIRASGGARLEGFSISQFLFNIRGDKVTVNYPEDLRSTVTADLELPGNRQAQFIRGNVEVYRTEYTKDIRLEEIINQKPAPSIEEGGQFKLADTAFFDKLHVEGRNALIMRNNLGDVVASVSLTIDGPVKEPIIEGRVTATRGTLNFRNNPYEITRGLIYFPALLGAVQV